MKTHASASATADAVPALISNPAKPAAARLQDAGSWLSPLVLAGVLRGVEISLLAGLGVLVAVAYVEAPAAQINLYVAASLAVALAAGGLFQVLGLYDVAGYRRWAWQLPRVVAAWVTVLAVMAAMVFFLKLGDAFSRVWLAGWCVSGAVVLVTSRAAVGAVLNHWFKTGQLVRRAVVYGHGASCAQLLAALASGAESGIRVCGVFDDRNAAREHGTAGAQAGNGRLEDLIVHARRHNIDLVLLALPVSAEGRLIDLLRRLWVLPADICLVASASRLRLTRRAYAYAGSVPLIPLTEKPIADWGLVAKSVFDRVIGVLALLVAAPVMIATAIAIKLDSKGPVLFCQKRYGFNNELIEVFKFRSMYVDMSDAAAAKLVTRDDPRVTRVGRFIRKTSLDELPQLFNVLIGNLSLVGPRPHAVSAKAAGKLYDEAVDCYFARHRVKPGITGWAQINGWRGETDTEDKLRHRIEHDLYYIENWSVLFDAYILARTPIALLKTDSAY